MCHLCTASKNSTGGCFPPRALRYDDCVLYQSRTTALVASASENAPKLPGLFDLSVNRAPITTRGWTFQERYLAGRTLMASEHSHEEQEYEVKPNIRSDGKLHSRADVEQVEERQLKYTPGPPGTDRILTPNRKHAVRNHWKATRKINPLYVAKLQKQASLLDASARLGVRGAFEFLWRFRGETLLEKIEFHNSWFEIVQQYSMRELTFGTDKAMAIAGVAYFIQQNTGLKYAAGLWSEMLPFNLLWATSGEIGPRPVRYVPTWSWTSVDGMIYHRLHVQHDSSNESTVERMIRSLQKPDKVFRSYWEEVTPLISNETLLVQEASNDLVHNASLQLYGHLCRFDTDKINYNFDVRDHAPIKELHCLPVLAFKNAHLHPKTKCTQIHGILIQHYPNSKNCFTRVRYF
jgi:hypothetical protein